MVIKPDQISEIWRGIAWWMKAKGITPWDLARITGYSGERIEKGIKGEPERLSSDLVRSFVDALGLSNTRIRSFEDTADTLTDEECIELLTAPLTESSI